MVTSLFHEERISTTVVKAKEARKFAERLITLAKRGDLHARRQAAEFLLDPKVVQKLFADLGPRFAARPGGYTRVIKTSVREGDDAPLAILELVQAELKPKTKLEKKKSSAKGATGGKSKGKDKSEAKDKGKTAAEKKAAVPGKAGGHPAERGGKV